MKRDGLSVELCKPYEGPKKWVTRSGEKAERFRVSGDLSKAVAAQLVWVSWNVLKTGLTPKRNGKMVYGMEVNWPGIMVLIQYQR